VQSPHQPRINETDFAPLPKAHRLPIEATEIRFGTRLLRVAGDPALAGHDLSEPAELPALGDPGAVTTPGDPAALPPGYFLAPARETLPPTEGTLLDIAAIAV